MKILTFISLLFMFIICINSVHVTPGSQAGTSSKAQTEHDDIDLTGSLIYVRKPGDHVLSGTLKSTPLLDHTDHVSLEMHDGHILTAYVNTLYDHYNPKIEEYEVFIARHGTTGLQAKLHPRDPEVPLGRLTRFFFVGPTYNYNLVGMIHYASSVPEWVPQL